MARALDALYDLWESCVRPAGLSSRDQITSARADLAGETAAALVHARGAESHALLEFGDLTDTYSATYTDHCRCSRWQACSDPALRFAERDGWCATRVAGQLVLPALKTAARWLGMRPELARQAP